MTTTSRETLAQRLRLGPLSPREATQLCRALLASLETRQAELERRIELRDLAAERLWMLLVQRESVGLRDHRELLQRIPQEIRKRIGPRRPLHPTD